MSRALEAAARELAESVEIEHHFAWWVKPYTLLLCFFAALTGRMPDEDKLVDVLVRGTKLRLKRRAAL